MFAFIISWLSALHTGLDSLRQRLSVLESSIKGARDLSDLSKKVESLEKDLKDISGKINELDEFKKFVENYVKSKLAKKEENLFPMYG